MFKKLKKGKILFFNGQRSPGEKWEGPAFSAAGLFSADAGQGGARAGFSACRRTRGLKRPWALACRASFLALPILLGFVALAGAQKIEMVGSADEKPLPKNAEVIDVTLLEERGEIQAPVSSAAQDGAENIQEAVRYTLGPDDVIEISVRRHPEFSDRFIINQEGKIQYKFVGDINVNGMTKEEVTQNITQLISKFIINPEVNVTILEYRSKVIYVVGEVGSPGKYYMRSDTIPIREAVVQAGLPTLAASMRKTRLIRPDKSGKPHYENVDLYKLLYEGDLKLNIDMQPGDVVYVPATLFAKIVRIINPVAAPVSSTETLRRAATGGF